MATATGLTGYIAAYRRRRRLQHITAAVIGASQSVSVSDDVNTNSAGQPGLLQQAAAGHHWPGRPQ